VAQRLKHDVTLTELLDGCLEIMIDDARIVVPAPYCVLVEGGTEIGFPGRTMPDGSLRGGVSVRREADGRLVARSNGVETCTVAEFPEGHCDELTEAVHEAMRSGLSDAQILAGLPLRFRASLDTIRWYRKTLTGGNDGGG
jgi:hypothetical protein